MAQTSRSNPAIGGAVPTLFNTMPDGKSVAVLGLGDGIAHILKAHVKAREEREAAETAAAEALEAKVAA